MQYMKRLKKIQREERLAAQKKSEAKAQINWQLQEHEERIQDFQKNHSVQKAADVLKLFERLAAKGSKINLQQIKKNIVRNLATRNKGLEPDEKYWSMQLLIRLGLIPDPSKPKTQAKEGITMNALERKKQLEELGVEIPKENMEQLNREMAQMAK